MAPHPSFVAVVRDGTLARTPFSTTETSRTIATNSADPQLVRVRDAAAQHDVPELARAPEVVDAGDPEPLVGEALRHEDLQRAPVAAGVPAGEHELARTPVGLERGDG